MLQQSFKRKHVGKIMMKIERKSNGIHNTQWIVDNNIQKAKYTHCLEIKRLPSM